MPTTIYEWGRRPWMVGPLVVENPSTRCMGATMEIPTIYGNPSHPWMVGIHKWDATHRGTVP